MEQLIQLHSVLKPHLQPNFKHFLSFFFFLPWAAQELFFYGQFSAQISIYQRHFK